MNLVAERHRLVCSLAFSAGMVLVAIACNDGSGGRGPVTDPARKMSSATPTDNYRAAMATERAEAERTPVSEDVRNYAQDLCRPYERLLDAASEVIASWEKTPSMEDAFAGEAALFAPLFLFGELVDDMQRFAEDMKTIRPPLSLASYHAQETEWIESLLPLLRAIRARSENLPAGFDDIPEPPQEPDGLDAALIQECDVLEAFPPAS